MASRCDSCEAAIINGVYCHETGCPKAWRDSIRQCKECGSEFTPEDSRQDFCDMDCLLAHAR